MLLIFYQIIDLNTPTYYNEDSVMSYRGVNPGLGFRPQLDPESELIKVDAQKFEENKKSIQIFLSKYEKLKDQTFSIEAKGKSNRKLSFNYKEIIKDTPCSEKNDFGYKSNPCVIVKLNKIYGWTPKTEKKPENLNLTDSVLAKDAIYVTCSGDGGVDRDNIKEIEYYSLLDSREVGGIPVEYFPYQNQKNYLSPLVFVHFKQVEKNTLINIVCKAHAENIDNSDRINQRGMVRFQLFVESKP
jgi:sodium/potassium-transporting ATPase subunit beta